MKFFKWLNHLAGRFNRWIGPTVAAESVLREGGFGTGGTQVDPLGLDLLNLQHQDQSDEPRR